MFFYLRSVGTFLVNLIALALNLDEQFFEKMGAFDDLEAFLRLLHYPGIIAFYLNITDAIIFTNGMCSITHIIH